jgi:hypothetical protein
MACLIADKAGVEAASGVTLASAAARSLNNDGRIEWKGWLRWRVTGPDLQAQVDRARENSRTRLPRLARRIYPAHEHGPV